MELETPYNLLVWGKGGHSKVVIDTVWNSKGPKPKYLVTIDDKSPEYNPNNPTDILKTYPPKDWVIFVAIGDNQARQQVFNRVSSLGYSQINVIHPTAYIAADASLQPNGSIYVGPHAVIESNAVIETGVIINTAATVDHDCYIDRFVHVGPGAHLCGGVLVGGNSLLGVGCCVIPNVRIPYSTTVGAGAAVVNDPTSIYSTVVGVPAKEIKK